MRRSSAAATVGLSLLLLLAACGPRFDVDALPQGRLVTLSPGAVPTGIGPTGGTGTLEPSAAPTAGPGPGGFIPKGPAVTDKVIKIGGLFPRSGGLSTLGEDAFRGAQAYFNHINAKGGVKGKLFKFIAFDDQADDTQSTAGAKKLVEQDGVFLMGPSFTPFSLTVINYLQQAGVPWVGYDGINIEGFNAPNVVTVGAPIESMAHVLLPQWFRKVEKDTGEAPKRIGAVVLDSAPSKAYLREAKNVICPKLGCSIVRETPVTFSTTEYGTICQNMQSSRVDAIWIVTDPASAVKLLVQCQAAGLRDIHYLGQHGIYMDLTLNNSGSYSNGLVANGAVLPESVNTKATQEMKDVIRTYYPDASFGYFTALAYSSAQMLVDLVSDVLDAGKELNRANIIEAAGKRTKYECHGLCKDVNLKPPAALSGGNHNIWLVKAVFSGSKGRWLYDAGPFDAFQSETWPCKGRPKPC